MKIRHRSAALLAFGIGLALPALALYRSGVRRLGYGGLRREWYTVVGVVADRRAAGIGTHTSPTPAIYLSALQHPPRTVDLLVRTRGEVEGTGRALVGVVGLAALMSHSVSRRSREIGVRMALGARPRDVVVLLLRESGRVTWSGVVWGVAGAVCLTRFLQLVFAGVPLFDPLVYAAALLALALTGVGAAIAPALRASRTDPAAALRSG